MCIIIRPGEGEGGWRSVGKAHVHYEAYTEICLMNTVILSVESNKSYNNDCIVIVDDYY